MVLNTVQILEFSKSTWKGNLRAAVIIFSPRFSKTHLKPFLKSCMCAFHEIQRCKNLLMWTFWGERNETSLLGHQSGFFLLNLIEDPLYIKLECKWSPHVHTKCIPYEHLIENSLPWNKDFFLKTKMGKKKKRRKVF